MITDTITLGNILTIVTMIGGVVITVGKVSSKVSAFITATNAAIAQQNTRIDGAIKEHEEMRKVDEENKAQVQSMCANCFMKVRVLSLETEREKMSNKQLELRAQLPLQLQSIDEKLSDMNEALKKVQTEVGKVQNDVVKIKIGLSKSHFVDIDE